jgi:acylphosphatase
MIRQTIHFSGTVQGVGFRYTADRLAGDFRVTGEVRNLRDGRVELIVEGEPDEIDAFVSALERAMSGCISDTSCRQTPSTGEFFDFRIAR